MFRLSLGNVFKYVTLQEGLQYIEFCRLTRKIVPVLEQEVMLGKFVKMDV